MLDLRGCFWQMVRVSWHSHKGTGFSSKELDSSEMINTFQSNCQLFLMFGHLTCYSLNAILKKSLFLSKPSQTSGLNIS